MALVKLQVMNQLVGEGSGQGGGSESGGGSTGGTGIGIGTGTGTGSSSGSSSSGGSSGGTGDGEGAGSSSGSGEGSGGDSGSAAGNDSIDLQIWNGQYHAASGPRNLNEGKGEGFEEYDPDTKQGGAFTVANLNDTDNDGRKDSDDDRVVTVGPIRLAANAAKGDTSVVLETTEGLNVGDLIYVATKADRDSPPEGQRLRIMAIEESTNAVSLDGALSRDYKKWDTTVPDFNQPAHKDDGFVTFGGRDEVDLMRLVIKPPVNANGDTSKKLVLTVVKGDVRLWEDPRKLTEVQLTNGRVEFSQGQLAQEKVLWVEVTKASKAVGDIELKAEFGNAAPDVVNATGIWFTVSDVKHDALDPLWTDLPEPVAGAMQNHHGFGLTPRRDDGIHLNWMISLQMQ